jgi:hypothetical protein
LKFFIKDQEEAMRKNSCEGRFVVEGILMAVILLILIAFPGRGRAEMTVDPAKTAFLLLHWQNDLATPGGKMAGIFPEILSSTRTIERVQTALKASREKGMMVIYINLAYRAGYPELPAKPAPFLADVAEQYEAVEQRFIHSVRGGHLDVEGLAAEWERLAAERGALKPPAGFRR